MSRYPNRHQTSKTLKMVKNDALRQIHLSHASSTRTSGSVWLWVSASALFDCSSLSDTCSVRPRRLGTAAKVTNPQCILGFCVDFDPLAPVRFGDPCCGVTALAHEDSLLSPGGWAGPSRSHAQLVERNDSLSYGLTV